MSLLEYYKKIDLSCDIMSDVIRKVKRKYGVDIFLTEYMLISAIKDEMGNSVRGDEGQMLLFAASKGIGEKILLFSFKNDIEKRKYFDDLFNEVNEYCNYNYKLSEVIINSFLFGLEIDAGFLSHNKDGIDFGVNNKPFFTNDYSDRIIYSYGIREVDKYKCYRNNIDNKVQNLLICNQQIPARNNMILNIVFDNICEKNLFIYQSSIVQKEYYPRSGKLFGMLKISNVFRMKSGEKLKLLLKVDNNKIMMLQVLDLKGNILEKCGFQIL